MIDKDLASELLAREVDADLFVMATDVDGVYEGWGTAEQRRDSTGSRPTSCAPMDFAAGSMGPKVDAAARFVEATGKRAAIGALADIEADRRGTRRHERRRRGSDRRGTVMADFGVHSEVGKLRKVMVHRPDLSLQRLTPTNHDELLFDDVLWVERAQHEHDQFVARMRERGVEVFLLSRAARRGAGGERRGTHSGSSSWSRRSTPSAGRSSTRSASCSAASPPDQLAKHLIGGLTVAEAGLDLAQGTPRSR